MADPTALIQTYPGLIGLWPMDETSGTVCNDVSGNGNDINYIGTPTLGQPSIIPFDPSGKSVYFPTVDEGAHIWNGDFNEIGDGQNGHDGEITFGAIVKTANTTSVSGKTIFNIDGQTNHAAMTWWSSDNVCYWITGNGATYQLGTTSLDDNTHHLIVGTIKRVGAGDFTITSYVDGVVEKQSFNRSAGVPGIHTGSNHFHFGANSSTREGKPEVYFSFGFLSHDAWTADQISDLWDEINASGLSSSSSSSSSSQSSSSSSQSSSSSSSLSSSSSSSLSSSSSTENTNLLNTCQKRGSVINYGMPFRSWLAKPTANADPQLQERLSLLKLASQDFAGTIEETLNIDARYTVYVPTFRT